MLEHPGFSPVALALGPVKIHWYGLMYLLGFYGFWWLSLRRGRHSRPPFGATAVSDLLFFGVVGVILGGRLGYTFFYNFNGFLADPVVILKIWEGGMSFHGGLLGVLVAMALYARSRRLSFFEVTDFIAPAVPFGLFTGRLGNFINQELWGAPTTLPWGMVFPNDPEGLPRHPSMLYEAGLEGLLLLAILLWFGARPRPRMAVSGLFLLLYGVFRSLVEFVRLPDAHIGYLAGDWLTMGHLLCLPMILGGLLLLGLAYRPRDAAPGRPRPA
ncbi:MAG TPA: prolipoprotein diacylglyceryl transferase [Nevskiaceae bacterium]|nr:prolipoprotein diacylglyceryl transferase [Nevskiaceae bacterium]